ncbi:MAG: gliding motility-associated C-terminal domain-containing protein, partial [Sphingobacteriales bacterium]
AGTFTATPAGLVINPVTGEVDLSASATGTYTVDNTVTGNGSCAAVNATTQITITLLQDASFTYSATQYCQTEANPSPIYTTGTVGTYAATPAGLSINTVTGEINLAASTAGTYSVTNTIAAAGNCAQVTHTESVTVTAQRQADFDYASAFYCKGAGTASPVYTNNGVAGNFSATPSGLSLNTTTGAIDLAGSAAGTYDVTNTIAAAGACIADTDTFTVTITEPYTGSISYTGSFCKNETNPQNVTNTAPVGGIYAAGSGLAIDAATGAIVPSASNSGTYEVSYTLPAHDGCLDFVTTTSVAVIPESPVTIDGQCMDTNYVITASPVGNSFDPATSTFAWSGSPFTVLENPWMIRADVATNGSWTVVVTTADGCTSTAQFNNPFTKCGLQKGISPNNDGSNDDFDLTAYNVKHLTIYNRYGTEVYQYTNYTNQWKGQTNTGDALPTATYFYAIDTYDGQQITGWIYINR